MEHEKWISFDTYLVKSFIKQKNQHQILKVITKRPLWKKKTVCNVRKSKTEVTHLRNGTAL